MAVEVFITDKMKYFLLDQLLSAQINITDTVDHEINQNEIKTWQHVQLPEGSGKGMPKMKYSWNVLIKSRCCNCSSPELKISTTFSCLCVMRFCEPSNASRFVVTEVAHSICVMECPFYRPYKPCWQGRRVTIHIVLTWTVSVKRTAVATKVRGVNLTAEMVYEVINLPQEKDRAF